MLGRVRARASAAQVRWRVVFLGQVAKLPMGLPTSPYLSPVLVHFTSPGSHSTTAGNATKQAIVTASAKKNGITPRNTS